MANDAEKRGRIDPYNPRNGLAGFVQREKIPMPNARDWKGPPGKGCQARGGRQSSLAAFAMRRNRRIPTPKMSDGGHSLLSEGQKNLNSVVGFLLRSGEKSGNALNPEWVEWVMGWPIGWTGIDPLPPDKMAAWSADPLTVWDHDPSSGETSPVPRTFPTKTVPNRQARLRAIGNGQVPQALVLAVLTLAVPA